MARPKNAHPTPADDGFNPERLEEAGEAAKQLATLQQGYGQGRDLVNQLLGQAQMADAFSQFSLTVRTSKLKIVKENKLHQHLAGSVTPDGQELKGTWAEFCALMKVSVQKADEDITNLRAFGEEALESMSQVGIGYRELRQFRRLPDDQKTALRGWCNGSPRVFPKTRSTTSRPSCPARRPISSNRCACFVRQEVSDVEA